MLADALGEEAAFSRSTVNRICQAIKDEFDAWHTRSLKDIELDYLYVDASRFRFHQGARAEPVLCAGGNTTDGKPVFLALASVSAESHDPAVEFLRELTKRGLRAPLLVITDGASGLISAIEQVFERSLRQRCFIHRSRNVIAKVSSGDQDEVKVPPPVGSGPPARSSVHCILPGGPLAKVRIRTTARRPPRLLVSMASELEVARKAFEERAWRAAFSQLATAHSEEALGLDNLELLAQAAYLSGEEAASEKAWIEANQRSVENEDWARAARCAFWLGVSLQARSERAQAGGWFARAQRVLEDNNHDCVERGWLLVGAGLKLHHERNYDASTQAWEQALEVGKRFHDLDLVATARQGLGRILIKQGRISEGSRMLDESMVAVLANEVSPIPAGIIYCSVIEACQEILDIARAQEWTAALSDWVDAQPDLVPYRGRCQIHRSEIMTMEGRWADAAEEIARACERLVDPPRPQLGMALNQQAEVHRLRGAFDAAEESYRQANRRAFVMQPGWALLKLAKGETEAAVAAIQRSYEATSKEVTRCRVLPAYVEIMLVAGNIEAAKAGEEELVQIAETLDSPLLRGIALRSKGAVLLAQGHAADALATFVEVSEHWSALEVPYESARLRLLNAQASKQTGDEHTVTSELDAAKRAFEQLGAVHDLKMLEALSGSTPARVPGGLSPREVEILSLVAKGRSNREIASELVISERTVARHMSNIFNKLDVTSRTAASAFAFENNLV